MRTIEAAEATLDLAEKRGLSDDVIAPELGLSHIKAMIETMKTTSMSQAKQGRWLGWIQAACVAGTRGRVTLDDCKRINMERRDD